jgi:hypothetical protein
LQLLFGEELLWWFIQTDKRLPMNWISVVLERLWTRDENVMVASTFSITVYSMSSPVIRDI